MGTLKKKTSTRKTDKRESPIKKRKRKTHISTKLAEDPTGGGRKLEEKKTSLGGKKKNCGERKGGE